MDWELGGSVGRGMSKLRIGANQATEDERRMEMFGCGTREGWDWRYRDHCWGNLSIGMFGIWNGKLGDVCVTVF